MRLMPRARPPKQLVDDRGWPIDPAAVPPPQKNL
jgi:hypothetical protein